jgi:hypothetical protein
MIFFWFNLFSITSVNVSGMQSLQGCCFQRLPVVLPPE